MEHLALEIFDLPTKDTPRPTGSKYANLPEDASITITDTSEIFASGDVWSHSFILNIEANLHIFGTSGETHGSRLHELIDGRRARLWVDGLPLYLGFLRLDNETEVDTDGSVSVRFESGQKTFEQMIDGSKANQVPMMDDVPIGMALWRKRYALCKLRLQVSARFDNGNNAEYKDVYDSMPVHTGTLGTDIDFSCDGEEEGKSVQQYPRMMFPKGDFLEASASTSHATSTFGRKRSIAEGATSLSIISVDCVNTDFPYDDAHPYCNVALCYQKQGYNKKQKDGSEIPEYGSEPEAERGYEYMPANRLNSAPNFFVIYWIRALMKQLGIYIEENQMMDIEDLKRLFFVNTKCAYKEPDQLRTVAAETKYGKYRFVHDSRDFKRPVPEYFGHLEWTGHDGNIPSYERSELVKADKSELKCKKYTIGEMEYDTTHVLPSDIPQIEKINVEIKDVINWTNERNKYEENNGYLHMAFATSECFPNVNISEVIDAIENGFGIRFLFNSDFKRVRIVLLKNIFKDSRVQNIDCEITEEDVKIENNVRGFRMTYGNSENTEFYYKGFADKMPHKKPYFEDDSDKHDYSHWKLDAAYPELIDKISAFDKTCYVTPNTGNSYIIKIDKDAKRYTDLHPSLLEGAGYMNAEDGDCSGDEETIKEVNVGFTPAIMNDVNWELVRSGNADGPLYALFVDEKMRPRRPELEDGVDYNDPETMYTIYSNPAAADGSDKGLYGKDSKAKEMTAGDGIVKPGEFAITSDIYATRDNLTANLYYSVRKGGTGSSGGGYHDFSVKIPLTFSVEGYINEGYRLYLQDNFEPNDDGISPIEKHDWGLMLGIMRGSGSDAHPAYSADPDDQEGNDTWGIIPGSSVTAHPDTCDCYGNLWDYNGTAADEPVQGRVSLKLRAEKPNPYFDPKKPSSPENPRYLEITSHALRQRGLCDQFYKEYSYWIRNARIVNLTVYMELAQLLAIDKTKRVTVGDVTGFIYKMQYSVSNKTGLGMVKMTIMYI